MRAFYCLVLLGFLAVIQVRESEGGVITTADSDATSDSFENESGDNHNDSNDGSEVGVLNQSNSTSYSDGETGQDAESNSEENKRCHHWWWWMMMG